MRNSESLDAGIGARLSEVDRVGIEHAVLVGSSPRAPEQVTRFLQEPFAAPHLFLGLNAAITLIAPSVDDPRHRIWSVANDWRVAGGLAAELAGVLGPQIVRVWTTNVKGANLIDSAAPWVPIKLLGDVGYSRNPTWGVYSGYTVAYLACQLVAATGIGTVTLLGIDLDYGLGGRPRFYGSPSAKTDRHVLGRQIANMRTAVEELRKGDVDVRTPEPYPSWFTVPSEVRSRGRAGGRAWR